MQRSALLFSALLACSSPSDPPSPTPGSNADSGSDTGNHGGDAGADAAPDYRSVVDEYLLSWNAPTADERAMHRTKALADDLIFTDPNIDGRGRDTFASTLETLLNALPTTAFTLKSQLQAVPGEVRFAFEIGTPNQAPLFSGIDHATIGTDGRIATLVSYFAPLPATAPLPAPLGAFVSMWSEADAAARATLLDSAASDDVFFADSDGGKAGKASLGNYVTDCIARGEPKFSQASGVDAFKDRFRVGLNVIVNGAVADSATLAGALATDGKIKSAMLYRGALSPL
jgi:hypothetical protein